MAGHPHPTEPDELMSPRPDEAAIADQVDACAQLLLEEHVRQEGPSAALQDIIISRGICLTQLGTVHEIMLRHGAGYIAAHGIAQLKRAIAARGLGMAEHQLAPFSTDAKRAFQNHLQADSFC